MIEQLATQIFNDIQDKLGQLNSRSAEGTAREGASKVKALISERLRALNLVTREEFDAQTAVLHRTREQLENMQLRLSELEKQSDS